MWLACVGKGINEEVGIRMFSLSQMTKVKLVCALAWRENFAKGNNSVTDTKRRMRDSPTLRLGTSWPSNGEGHARCYVSFRYLMGACRTRMPIDKQRDYAVEGQDWRAGKEIRSVRLQAVLLGSSMRFDKRKGIKEKKQEEGQVSLYSLWVVRQNNYWNEQISANCIFE